MAWIQVGKRIYKRHTVNSFAKQVVPKYVKRGLWTQDFADKFVARAKARVAKDPSLKGYNKPPRGSKILKKLPKNLTGFKVIR